MDYTCPYCKNEDVHLYKENQKYRTVQKDPVTFFKCPVCNTIFPKPRLNFTDLPAENSKLENNPGNFSNPTTEIHPSEAGCITTLIKEIQKKKTINLALDIGASNGRFCFILKSLGIGSRGIDIDEEAVACAQEYNIEVYPGNFPYEIPEKIASDKYDLISLNEVIYYFDDMEKSLEKISDLLKDDGFILIKTN